MIRLYPILDVDHTCPYCQVSLEVKGWYIPGMRNLADLECPKCGREFYGDLPSGHGLHYPMLLEKATGVVHDRIGVPWFANWLRESYAERRNEPLGLEVEEKKPVQRGVLLNCLDTLYGHCLLKLLNAQCYLDQKPDLDLIVMVPHFLRWLVPDGAAAVWTVDLPLSRGTEWNDWLAQQIHRRVEVLDKCYLSVVFSHPHPDDFQIERFSRIKPFPLDEWEERLEAPTITFIWREDRLWNTTLFSRALRRAQVYLNRLGGGIDHSSLLIHEQTRKIVKLAEKLKKQFPTLDFAVAGLGEPGGFPSWITDLRVARPDETTERILCKRYARSHIVIGVHGSNMLLPSAHAGAVVELMPKGRWGNVIQDMLLQKDDQRETLFRYRILPMATSIDTLSNVVTSVLSDRAGMLLHMQRKWCDHGSIPEICTWSDIHTEFRERQRDG